MPEVAPVDDSSALRGHCPPTSPFEGEASQPQEAVASDPAVSECNDLASLLVPQEKSRSSNVDIAISYTVVIVGAGIAGSTMAHLIRRFHPSVRVILCEQLDRLGGRANTVRVPTQDGKPSYIVEKGCELVNDDHATIKALCQDLEIGLIPTYDNERNTPDFAILESGRIIDDVRYCARVLSEAVKRDVELLKTDEGRKLFDQMSALEYVRNLDLTDVDKRQILQFLETEQGISNNHMSASFVIEFMDFQTFERGWSSFYASGDDKYVIENGTATLVERLVATSEDNLRLGCSVNAIVRSSSGMYRVYTDSKQEPILADFVVLAIPGPAAKHIEMVDELSDIKRSLLGLHYSEVDKTCVRLAGRPLNVFDKYDQILATSARALVWKSYNGDNSTHRTQLSLYRGGGNVGYNLPRKNQLQTVQQLVDELSLASNVLISSRQKTPSVLTMETEAYTAGFAQPRRGRGADFRHGTPSEHEGVFLIGEHMAKADPQTMEGAAESAVRVFRKLQKFLPRAGVSELFPNQKS